MPIDTSGPLLHVLQTDAGVGVLDADAAGCDAPAAALNTLLEQQPPHRQPSRGQQLRRGRVERELVRAAGADPGQHPGGRAPQPAAQVQHYVDTIILCNTLGRLNGNIR